MIAVTEYIALESNGIVRPDGDAERFPDALLRQTAFDRAVALPSGRAALWYALRDAGLEQADEVLIPSFTDLSVKRAVGMVARPVPVDVEPDSYNLDLEDARGRVTDRTAAIVPTHLWGEPIDMRAVAAFAAEHDLLVVEDAAHALGTTYTSEQVGRFSDYCLFSFRFTKEVTSYKGGLLLLPAGSTAPRKRVCDRLSPAKLGGVLALSRVLDSIPGQLYHPLRNRLLDPYFRTSAGRVTDVTPQSFSERERSLLAGQYERLADRVAARRRHASRYDEGLVEGLERPPSVPGHGYFRYSLRVPASRRDPLYRALQRRGIGCSKSYSYTVSAPGECPVADRTADRVLNLPVHAGLDDGTVDRIVDVVNATWDELR
ncbi:DegT/DnrJ/EryC1/StrS family aminotransferase [Halalkalicoccus ordinarius]|uniref:DegT/DnrJ/EryC1/StrS family aminotransferase n=1 Tax=Halalkalicoccus ordinarius TaxID=3116651 RepID=UPI00300E7701